MWCYVDCVKNICKKISVFERTDSDIICLVCGLHKSQRMNELIKGLSNFVTCYTTLISLVTLTSYSTFSAFIPQSCPVSTVVILSHIPLLFIYSTLSPFIILTPFPISQLSLTLPYILATNTHPKTKFYSYLLPLAYLLWGSTQMPLGIIFIPFLCHSNHPCPHWGKQGWLSKKPVLPWPPSLVLWSPIF